MLVLPLDVEPSALWWVTVSSLFWVAKAHAVEFRCDLVQPNDARTQEYEGGKEGNIWLPDAIPETALCSLQ